MKQFCRFPSEWQSFMAVVKMSMTEFLVLESFVGLLGFKPFCCLLWAGILAVTRNQICNMPL